MVTPTLKASPERNLLHLFSKFLLVLVGLFDGSGLGLAEERLRASDRDHLRQNRELHHQGVIAYKAQMLNIPLKYIKVLFDTYHCITGEMYVETLR